MKKKYGQGNKLHKKSIMNTYSKQNIIIFLTMAILLFVVLLSFWPGIVTIDGNNQWKQIESEYIINNHPFFSTFFWWILTKIWCTPTILCVFQILLLSTIWTSICFILRRENNFSRRWLYTVLLCFIPVIFLYSVTTWKDVIYSYMLLIIAVMLYVGVKKNYKYSYWNLFIINLAMAFVWSYRYNGIIVTLLLLISLFIIFVKNKVEIKKILIGSLMFISILALFKIPEKIMCHPQNNQSGNDIAMYILASLVQDDKIDSQDDWNIINDIYTIDKLKEEYNPYVVNPISFSKYYNRDLAQEHSDDIIRILIKYTLKNPLTVIKHYLQADNLLIGIRYGNGYVYMYEFDTWYTKFSGDFNKIVSPVFNKGYDFYLGIINFTGENEFFKMAYLPAYSLYISIILMIIYAKKMKEKRYFLILLPMIFNTISLLPINVAQDLRYVYINYLTLLLLVIPLFFIHGKNVNRSRKKSIEMKEKPKALVIIPAYNEGKSIKKVVDSVYNENIENCDVIVINDGSKDNTYEEAKKTKAIVINAPNNLGIGGAVQTGYIYAKDNNYDIAIQIDGDGQHNPKYINQLIEEIKNGNDLVIGSRFIKKTSYDQTIPRMLGINILSFVIKLMTKVKIYDTTSGYRAVNKSIIQEFAEEYPYDYPEPCTNTKMIKNGYKIKEIPVEMEKRVTGISSISPLKSVGYMFKVVLSILLMGLKE